MITPLIDTDINKKSVVYCAVNQVNNKIYIGLTSQILKRRIATHICKSKNPQNNYFHNALNTHGKDSFKWYVLYQSNDINQLKEKETFYINEFKSNDREKGYNLSTGGECPVFNQESCEKISKKAKERNLNGENNPFYGKKHSEETRKHLSKIRKGIRFSPFTKHSEETKKKLSEIRKELCKDPQHILNMALAQKRKPLLCVTNGVEYISMSAAAKELNLSLSGLKFHLNKKNHLPYYGYVFQFI
jgi:group I intron endonuclease